MFKIMPLRTLLTMKEFLLTFQFIDFLSLLPNFFFELLHSLEETLLSQFALLSDLFNVTLQFDAEFLIVDAMALYMC